MSARLGRLLSPAARLRAGVAAALVATLTAGLLTGSQAAQAAIDPCGVGSNPIVCENSKPGTPNEEWDIIGAGDDTIQGFSTDISVNKGSRVDFKVKSAANYRIDVFRLGYYNGAGARLITSMASINPQNQPACLNAIPTDTTDCGNWAVSAGWTVPSSAVSGVYIAKLTRNDTRGASHIPFVVRDDASTSKLFFQTSDTTWHAYNIYGGANFYEGARYGRAYGLSYNRPIATRDMMDGRDYLFANEYPMLRFLERNGYDMSYTTGVDSDRRGHLIRNHKVFLSVGHDEYWTGPQRANVEAARDAGVSLAFFSGNEVYWRGRWTNSVDGGTAYRTFTSYKETWANESIDPTTEWTGTFRDPRFSPPAVGGGKPENALTGTAYMANSVDLAIQVPAEQGKYRLWRNTSVANQISGSATLAPHTVGYESDEDLDNGFRPPGLIRLSTTTGPTSEYLRDFGNTVTPGTTTHHLTMYRAASGALVFGAGTIQWPWGLDTYHDGTVEPVDPRMQQATINLLADMGAQPLTLMAGMVPATASTDTAAPTATITTAGASVPNGNQVTVQGTAADTGGGRVAGVEVSTDDGVTWRPATGTTSWSYSWYTTGLSSQTIRARATDDSANIGVASAPRQFTLTGPNTLFGNRTPAVPAANEVADVQLGVKFTPQVDGMVTGVRFYKASTNTGTHTGTLWSTAGSKLASGTFTNETASGWQKLTFSKPVNVAAGQTYVVSYRAPNGRYSADANYFSGTDHKAFPLTAPRSTDASKNGVYGQGDQFPQNSYQATNYYVDVTFVASTLAPPMVISQDPLPDSTGVKLDRSVSVSFSKALNPATIAFSLRNSSNQAVAGATSYDAATKTATFNPTADLTVATRYTATIMASDTNGNAMEQAATWSFTAELNTSAATLFGSRVPANASDPNDNNPVELGVRFTPTVSGKIIGIRFYQGPGNTGTHTGSLWSSTGTLLRRVTFGPTSGLGWQYAAFDTAVDVTANTTYVASYFAPNGNQAYEQDFFAFEWTSGQLKAPADNNGVYASGGGFPTSTWRKTNYWVDPLFVAGPPVPPETPGPVPEGVNVFTAGETPQTLNDNDPRPNEVGVKFSVDAPGQITGMRFYKGDRNTGTHVGTLWSATGQQLARATFRGEAATGWQYVQFSAPVTVTPGVTYVASYHTSVGYYSSTSNQFASPLDRGSIHIPGMGGVYTYGAGGFPTTSTKHNYWVDVYFKASGSTTPPPAPTGSNIFTATETPAILNDNDPNPNELGVKFTVDTPGRITGMRFYKGPTNTGLHVGTLWSATGQQLARAIFTHETASGWQYVSFSTPVNVTTGTTYVASYHTSAGNYSATANTFAGPLDRPPLHVPTQGSVWAYGDGGFPTNSSNHNYWVDVYFQPTAGGSGVAGGTTSRISSSDKVPTGADRTVDSTATPPK